MKDTFENRRKLWIHGKQYTEQGGRVSLDYCRLPVDDDVFTWDDLKDSI